MIHTAEIEISDAEIIYLASLSGMILLPPMLHIAVSPVTLDGLPVLEPAKKSLIERGYLAIKEDGTIQIEQVVWVLTQILGNANRCLSFDFLNERLGQSELSLFSAKNILFSVCKQPGLNRFVVYKTTEDFIESNFLGCVNAVNNVENHSFPFLDVPAWISLAHSNPELAGQILKKYSGENSQLDWALSLQKWGMIKEWEMEDLANPRLIHQAMFAFSNEKILYLSLKDGEWNVWNDPVGFINGFFKE